MALLVQKIPEDDWFSREELNHPGLEIKADPLDGCGRIYKATLHKELFFCYVEESTVEFGTVYTLISDKSFAEIYKILSAGGN